MAPRQFRYLLLQVRNPDDPMRAQEVACFSRALACSAEQITVFDLLQGAPTGDQLQPYDCVLLGGSGDYSVAEGGDWFEQAMAAMRQLCELSKPTFASCWGCQAMAQAMGGRVVTDLPRAEIGSVEVTLTAAGERDSLFRDLGSHFVAQMGHQDRIVDLPQTAILLASTERVENQAFRFRDKPIYCTQFHPELNREALLERLVAYPWYVESITGMSLESFAENCKESPQTDQLLGRFVRLLAEGRLV